MSDLVDDSGSHKLVSRVGKVKRQRLGVNQSLYAGRRAFGTFFAIVRDPETGETISQAAIWTCQPGEAAELLIEFELAGRAERDEDE